MKAKLISIHDIAPNTRHFDFETLDFEANFVPGQFYSVTAFVNEEPITRAYSIASPPGGRTFSLCANLVPDGRLTPHVFALQPGEEVDLTGPWGSFILRREPADSIFVATGTGITPFRSMLHAHVAERPAQNFTLIFGARHELLYHHEFEELAARHPNFTYLPTLTRPLRAWEGRTGRVQPLVMETLGDRRDVDVYICGLKEMVDDLRTQLKACGLDRKRIIYEKYD